MLFYTLFGVSGRIQHVHIARMFAHRTVESPARLEAACLLMEDLADHGLMGSTVTGLNKTQVGPQLTSQLTRT